MMGDYKQNTARREDNISMRLLRAYAGLYIRNSKHNRYCGGLLIRSPMDFGVQVRVLPVPPFYFA